MDIRASGIIFFIMTAVSVRVILASMDTFVWRLTAVDEYKDTKTYIVEAVYGLLNVRKNQGKWMAICYNWKDKNVSSVACRQMGYLGLQKDKFEGKLQDDIFLQNFSCPTGNEESINFCHVHQTTAQKCPLLTESDSLALKVNCTTDLGLYRLLNAELKDGDVHSGTLEYTHRDGTARHVCYNDSNAESVARVVCKQMGYSDMVNVSYVASSANKSVNLECTGNEKTLAACTFKNIATSNSGYFLAIECKLNMILQNFFDVRLSSPNNSASQGTVEIWKYGRWGVLCDQDWTMEDANVVCRQLGYRHATDAPKNAMYGQGGGVVFWDKVNCTGHEFSIAECPHSIAVASTATCDSTKAAGVNCDIINPLTSNYICANETILIPAGANDTTSIPAGANETISIPAGYSFLRFPNGFSYEKGTTCSCELTNLTATTAISLYIQKKMFTENHVESLTFYDNSSHWTFYGDNSSAGPFNFTNTDNFTIQFKSETSAGEGYLNILIKASDALAFTCTKDLSAIDITATSTTLRTSDDPGKETPVVSSGMNNGIAGGAFFLIVIFDLRLYFC